MIRLFFASCFAIISFASVGQQDQVVSFSMEGVTELTVEGRFLDVNITKSGSRSLDFKGYLEGRRTDDYEILYDRSGNSLRVYIEGQGSNMWNWNTGDDDSRMEFKVPDGVDVVVKNSSGDIFVDGLSGSFHNIEASSGDIEISNVRGELKATASSGDLEIRKAEGDLTLDTSSGDQEIEQVTGDISFKASSGDVSFRSIAGFIKGKTSSGDIEFNAVTGAFDVEASSGDIEADRMAIKGRSSFVATSGDIRLSLDQDLSSLDFEAKSNSGNITIGNNRGDDYMMLKNDSEILVYCKTSSGSIKIFE